MRKGDYSGPAFPVRHIIGSADSPGMTLRDYFAAKALQGVVGSDSGYVDVNQYAKWAYQVADAMLEARE